MIGQSAASLTATETQIELGNAETHAETQYTLLDSPKVFLFDEGRFDGTVTIYAEATLTAAGGGYARL